MTAKTAPSSTSPLLACAGSVSLPDGVADWIPLMPFGVLPGRDGRGPYLLRDADHAAAVIAATTRYQAGADPYVDYDHQTQRAEQNGQPAPAAGWIKAFEIRDDGLWGRVDWTAKAAAMLTDKEFRYISPTFWHGPDGTVLRLAGAALTNTPNLQIPAIAAQQPNPAPTPCTGDIMNPTEAPTAAPTAGIAVALGLAADTPAASLATQCQALKAGVDSLAALLGLPATTTPDQLTTAAQTAVQTLGAALKLQGPATLSQLATAAQSLSAPPAVDPTQWVPMAVHLATASALTTLQQTQATASARQAVDAAVLAGKVTPAMRDWALALASQDPAAFGSYVAAAPVLVTAPGSGSGVTPQSAPSAPPSAQGLSAEELAVASQLGLTPDAYAKTLAEDGR